jgi:uncharacterized protein YkwD
MMQGFAPSLPRRVVAAVLILVLASALVVHSGARARAEGSRSTLLHLVNRTREHHDLRRVKLNRSLSRDAHHWSQVMLRNDRIYDPPDLSRMLAPYDWNRVGADVVGCGGTLHRVHRAFMHDASHRAIILDSEVRRVGIGVVRADTKNRCGNRSFWVTEIYYG